MDAILAYYRNEKTIHLLLLSAVVLGTASFSRTIQVGKLATKVWRWLSGCDEHNKGSTSSEIMATKLTLQLASFPGPIRTSGNEAKLQCLLQYRYSTK